MFWMCFKPGLVFPKETWLPLYPVHIVAPCSFPPVHPPGRSMALGRSGTQGRWGLVRHLDCWWWKTACIYATHFIHAQHQQGESGESPVPQDPTNSLGFGSWLSLFGWPCPRRNVFLPPTLKICWSLTKQWSKQPWQTSLRGHFDDIARFSITRMFDPKTQDILSLFPSPSQDILFLGSYSS